MSHHGRTTSTLLAATIGLGVVILLLDGGEPSFGSAGRMRVFDFDSTSVSEIRIRATTGEVTELNRTGADWSTAGNLVRADENEVAALIHALSIVEVRRRLGEMAGDLEVVGLAVPRLTLGFRLESSTELQEIQIGLPTVTGDELYARLAGQTEVFLIPAWIESTFDRRPTDILMEEVLTPPGEPPGTAGRETAPGSTARSPDPI